MSRRTNLTERIILGLLFTAMAGVGLLTIARAWLEVRAPGLYRDGQPELVGVAGGTTDQDDGTGRRVGRHCTACSERLDVGPNGVSPTVRQTRKLSVTSSQ